MTSGAGPGHLLADGYSPEALADHLARCTDLETFFADVPAPHPWTIVSSVC